VVRERPGSDHPERLEIARIDSGAADFDELFVRGERRAHERAFLGRLGTRPRLGAMFRRVPASDIPSSVTTSHLRLARSCRRHAPGVG